jgi:Sortase domain
MGTVVPALVVTLALGGVLGTTCFASSGSANDSPALAWAHDRLPVAANTAPPVPVAVEVPTPPPPPPQPIRRVTSAPPPPTPVDHFSMPHANWVMVPSVGIDVAVGSYTDCSGNAPVLQGIASRDWCAEASNVYLVGHNPGVFAALPRVHDGALVRYWDSKGQAFTYRVKAVFQQDRTVIFTPGPPHLVFQTCANAKGSIVWMVIAYPA